MKILLTNDDGYAAPGIQVLYESLRPYHKVVLIAPDREKSAVSHGITLNDPIRMSPVRLNDGDDGYAVTGTPADCVKLGLFDLFTTPPDLIISGINPGCNTGVDINYSGTVSAAREGALNGILSIAVSIKTGKTPDFQGMSRFIANIVDKVYDNGLPSGTFLNINAPDIPLDEVKGVKITRQASNNLSKQFDKRVDPKNRSYYWYGRIDQVADEPDSDITAVLQGYISITPVQCDITNYSVLAELEPFQLP
ncbi:5'/3'-nucleotidase SurE [Desulfobacula phenolica]|uniref:5'-nucleotidase SurE n=1 Tax=Desulfobacula phenolica TaxID=90732 RepID=A0A1H2DNI4_9BACT|nr:5'/3'-nucleotidase SurE [Desulfobacula phenolica]SDT84399.1 5'-nucleotidase /3'-nucleotidase /exopolyphosphatase [Desulfobacula phenolica]